MQRAAYALTSEFEATHWWFLSRRDLFLKQVRLAANEIKSSRSPQADGLKILDYGCGTGFNLSFLAEFGQVTGADVAPESLVEFQKTKGFSIVDLGGDTSDLRGSFDIVTALDVLEHIDDDVVGLKQIGHLLKPDGQLILTVPAYSWLWSGEDEISLHKRRYTMGLLTKSCQAANFEIRFMSYFNLSILPLMTAVIWAKRAFFPTRALRESNVKQTRDWLNRFLYQITAWENCRIGTESLVLPAGASLVCRLKMTS